MKINNFIWNHKKKIAIVIIIIISLYIITTIMTRMSISCIPLKLFDDLEFDTLQQDISIEYDGSYVCEESIPIASIVVSSGGNVLKIVDKIRDSIDITSALSNTSGNSGTLTIPTNSLGLSFGNLGIYGWEKQYKICFNQIDCSESRIVIFTGNYALLCSLNVGNNLGASVEVYQLR